MRKHQYESAVIINASLEDAQITAIVNKLTETIVLHGGELVNTDIWGRKRLTYPIKKCKVGYYVIFRFEAPATALTELERIYRLDENIIRFLTLKLSKFALEYFSEQEQKAAAAKIAEEELALAESINDMDDTLGVDLGDIPESTEPLS